MCFPSAPPLSSSYTALMFISNSLSSHHVVNTAAGGTTHETRLPTQHINQDPHRLESDDRARLFTRVLTPGEDYCFNTQHPPSSV